LLASGAANIRGVEFDLGFGLHRPTPLSPGPPGFKSGNPIQLRAAAFNLPNYLNPSTPNTSPLSNTLGYERQKLRPDHQRHQRK
jgi:hypothetical protein